MHRRFRRLFCGFVFKCGYDSRWNDADREHRQPCQIAERRRKKLRGEVRSRCSVKGNVVLKAGTKVFGKIASSRANPRKSEPLSVELASVSVNGRNVPVKTNSVEPHGPPQTARQAHYGHTAGTTVVNPGTRMQFQLLQSVTL